MMGPADAGLGMANKTVTEAATQRGALDRGAVALLGVYGPQGNMQALLRMPSGRVKKIKPGSRVNSGRVAAIDDDGLIIERNGEARRMKLLQ